MNFFNSIQFFERGYKYLFQINNFIWKTKRFLLGKKKFCKNHTYFFLKNIIIFRIVLIDLNNHSLNQIDSNFDYWLPQFLLKLKAFWNKIYDVMILIFEVINKILLRDSNNIVNVVSWPKFPNTSISIKEVTIILIL